MYALHLSLGFCERRYVIFMLCKLTLSCYSATLRKALLAAQACALKFRTLCDVRGFCLVYLLLPIQICRFRTMLHSCGLKN